MFIANPKYVLLISKLFYNVPRYVILLWVKAKCDSDLMKSLLSKVFHECNGTLIMQIGVGVRRNVCGMVFVNTLIIVCTKLRELSILHPMTC